MSQCAWDAPNAEVSCQSVPGSQRLDQAPQKLPQDVQKATESEAESCFALLHERT